MRLLPVLQALRFNHRSTTALKAIPRSEWPNLLRMTDREGLTLPLGIRCAGLLPPLVEARIQHNLDNNARRHSRLVGAYAGIAGALQSQALPFAVLKGLSKSQYYAADLRHRPQYDIDLYVPAEALSSARCAIEALGYEALPDGHSRDADHLPRMIRRTAGGGVKITSILKCPPPSSCISSSGTSGLNASAPATSHRSGPGERCAMSPGCGCPR